MAPSGFSGRRQFEVACGVLSRCVKAEAATVAKTMAEAPPAAAAAPTTTTAPPTMLLMPSADVTPDVREAPAVATTVPQLAQLTITYGDRVLVFDDFPSHRVAELVLVAKQRRPDVPGAGGTANDIPAVARKASLQRFMDKRRDRLIARAPYAVAARPTPASSNKEERRNQQNEQDDAESSWLGLGVPGGCAC